MALAIDEVTATDDAADMDVTSASFNVDEGDILVALSSHNGNTIPNSDTVTYTCNTPSVVLIRTDVNRSREAKSAYSIWRCTAAATGVTIRAQGTGSTHPGSSISVVEVSGAWKHQPGASGASSLSSGTPSCNVTAKFEGSYLFSAMADWSAGTLPGPGSSPAETELNDHTVATEYTAGQNRTTNTVAKGSVSNLDYTGSSTRNYSMIAVEICERPPVGTPQATVAGFPKPKMRRA